MWNRFFPAEELTKSELLELTLKHFHPLPTREIEILFEITRDMLKKLDVNHSDFNEQFNKIVFGTMLIALVIETKKYRTKLYPYVDNDDFNVMNTLRNLRDPRMKSFIHDIGAKVLSNELPFDSAYIDKHFSTLAEKVPSIKQRIKVNTSNAIDAARHENQNSWRLCNIL
jgi:hypothetical protein